MKYYFAPMEGITLYPLRNVHKELFPDGVDKYYTPFVTATKHLHFKNREKKDILPENSGSFSDYGTPRPLTGQQERLRSSVIGTLT